MNSKVRLLDCTLRDGGYYNDWNFDNDLIFSYLDAMAALDVDFVEIGFRFTKNSCFKGAFAFSKDEYIESLPIPKVLQDKIGVMINGVEFLPKEPSIDVRCYQEKLIKTYFKEKSSSPVSLVRIACHFHEFEACLPMAIVLKKMGYLVGFNLMQIADRSEEDIRSITSKANDYPIDVLYFADSMGSLSSVQTMNIATEFSTSWRGEVGIHAHDNMGMALKNSLDAVDSGVTWVDSTVTGMGRGPGNTQTEYLALSFSEYKPKSNPTKLFELIRKYFKPLQNKYGWGTNPYYYLAGKFGIHPSYIQEMLADSRYVDEDMLAVIEHLKVEGGKKFDFHTLDAARHFYSGSPKGRWMPSVLMKGRDVLILGTGPGVDEHKDAIEAYIEKKKPFVIALNTQRSISQSLIDLRAACHPVRLLADCSEHLKLPQPLVTPASMLPDNVKIELEKKELLDYGVSVVLDTFEFHSNYCVLPNSLVLSYSLALANSGQANKIMIAGFDGYGADDPRRKEVDSVFKLYVETENSISIYSITQTRYEIPIKSIYGLL